MKAAAILLVLWWVYHTFLSTSGYWLTFYSSLCLSDKAKRGHSCWAIMVSHYICRGVSLSPTSDSCQRLLLVKPAVKASEWNAGHVTFLAIETSMHERGLYLDWKGAGFALCMWVVKVMKVLLSFLVLPTISTQGCLVPFKTSCTLLGYFSSCWRKVIYNLHC